MPTGLRKLFDAQFEKTEDGKIVERTPKIVVHKSEQKVKITELQDPKGFTPDLPEFVPYRAMNVGADEVALSKLNKTETRYLEILRSRPENLWIGVHVWRARIAANTHYTPDFATLDTDGVFTFYDSKGGFVYEDSQLKMKLVARMFPFFRWVKAELILATRKKPERLKETVFKG